jgi:NTP pyrophosphatase (non-canonical NTP hydrolase)
VSEDVLSADIGLCGTLAVRPEGRSATLCLDTSPSPRSRPVLVRGSMALHEGRWVALHGIEAGGRDLACEPEPQRLRLLLAARPAGANDHAVRQDDDGVTLHALAEACPSLAVTAAPGTDERLRELQDECRDLYGRLEPERALAWALEELGELAQAMRRGKSTTRIEEELGQVIVWGLCLANITRVDAAHAYAKAVATERGRQLRKHGALRPYRRPAPC